MREILPSHSNTRGDNCFAVAREGVKLDTQIHVTMTDGKLYTSPKDLSREYAYLALGSYIVAGDSEKIKQCEDFIRQNWGEVDSLRLEESVEKEKAMEPIDKALDRLIRIHGRLRRALEQVKQGDKPK